MITLVHIQINKYTKLIANVISACEETGAKLVFLDNVYMYGPVPLSVPVTENHSQNTVSEKGKVRKSIAEAIVSAHQKGRIRAIIGRSADFYGDSPRSPLYISFLERMLKGESPQIVGGLDVPHTYAYTSDIGKALVALSLDEAAYGEVWHLPVSRALQPGS